MAVNIFSIIRDIDLLDKAYQDKVSFAKVYENLDTQEIFLNRIQSDYEDRLEEITNADE